MIKVRALQTDGFYRKLPVQPNIEDDNLGSVKMYRAILDYALVDAIRTTTERQYFKDRSEDFEEVCYLAGIDSDWVNHTSKLFFREWDNQNRKEKTNVSVSITINFRGSGVSVASTSTP